MGMPETLSKKITWVLGFCVLSLIIIKEFYIKGGWEKIKDKPVSWITLILNIICFFIILFSDKFLTAETDYGKKLLLLIITVSYMGSIIMKQLIYQYKNSKKNCGWDFFIGNLYNYDSLYSVFYISLYLILSLLLMVILLKRADDNYPDIIFNLFGSWKYLIIILLPLILVLMNELTAIFPFLGVSSNKYISSTTAFKKFVGGGYKEINLPKIIITVSFIALLVLCLFNYTGGASPYGGPILFENYLSGDSNLIVYIILFGLGLFNILLRGLFIQQCSIDNVQKASSNNKVENAGEGMCEISKYGGLLVLLFISYTVSVLYKIRGMRDKGIAIAFIIISIFGLTELFINTDKH